MSRPDWHLEDLWLKLVALWPGITVEWLPEVDSTNSELMRRARQGQTDPVLLVTERQTAGRGRMGRSWVTPEGSALTFSIGLPLKPGLSTFSLPLTRCLKSPSQRARMPS